MSQENYDILSAFGLTGEQTRILFSLEYLLASEDADRTKNGEKKAVKRGWASRWCMSVEELLRTDERAIPVSLYNKEEVLDAINKELSTSSSNTWYHLVLLEAIAFEAYTPLGRDAVADKSYGKLDYTQQLDYIKDIATKVGVGSPEMVDRYNKSYDKALNKATGKTQKIIRRALIVVAAAGVVAATAGALAGPIAVALAGSSFAGLSGAALISASLAYLGGGAIAAGGAGMAGGVIAIVGGGALLGAAGSGAVVAGTSALAKNNPDLTISQGAKLTVVLREIILNNQKDTKAAQAVMQNLKNQIIDLQSELTKLNLEKDKNKQLIENLKKSIKALENLYHDNNAFTSAFEIGMEAADEIEVDTVGNNEMSTTDNDIDKATGGSENEELN